LKFFIQKEVRGDGPPSIISLSFNIKYFLLKRFSAKSFYRKMILVENILQCLARMENNYSGQWLMTTKNDRQLHANFSCIWQTESGDLRQL
jgi:hypothetical protein